MGGAGLATILGAFLVVIGAVLSLAFGFGALSLSGWAWTLGVFVQALHLIGYVLRLLGGNRPGASLIGILLRQATCTICTGRTCALRLARPEAEPG